MRKKIILKRIISSLLLAGILVISVPADLIASETDEFEITIEDVQTESSEENAKENKEKENDCHIEEVTLESDNYAEDEVFAFCDSKEEAEQIAEAYTAVTGHEFTLIDYAYSVAVYSINDNADSTSTTASRDFQSICDCSDTVTAAVSTGLDRDFDLAEVYPNDYLELMSVEKPDNSRETFNDPFTRSDNEKYQWYHEMLGDKLLWDEMDKLETANADPNDDIEYNGPLPLDFIDNLNNEVVAIIDSGINDTQEDFVLQGGNTVIVSPSDVTGVATGYKDLAGHGSNVAGIIANVADNGKGGRGIASGVKIMPINVCPNSSGTGIKTASSVQALNMIVEKKEAYLNGDPDGLNICVVNMSLGGTSYNAGFDVAVQNTVNHGITVVAAATNSNSSAYGYPASFDNVISVASVNSYYVKSSFSNYGDKVSISAPGGERFNTYIDEIGVTSTAEECYASSKNYSDAYIGYHGTSQASPMVSACAALLYAKNPGTNPADVKKQMENTAKPVYGSYQIGKGCLNVAAALGVDRKIQSPCSDKESGIVSPDGFDVNISLPGISNLSDYKGSIYYTIDGSDPELRTNTSTYELNLSDPQPIHFEYNEAFGKETETLKLLNVLYGKKSEIVSYQYNYYLGDDIPKILRRDGIGIDNSIEIAEGKSIGLKLTDKKSGKEIKASWSSSDPMTAAVDGNGLISGINVNNSGVSITATPLDEGFCPVNITIYVKPQTTKLEVLPDEAGPNIELYYGDTYDLSDKWRIYPNNAATKVSYSSSNPSIARVDEHGIVTPLRTGLVVIKVSASDGSGIYDTVNFTCSAGLDSFLIVNRSGRDFLSAGGTMKFDAVSNDGGKLPENADVYWDFSSESKAANIEAYASINHSTGAVSAGSNLYVYNSRDVIITATSVRYNVSASYEFKLYPRVTSLSLGQYYNDASYGCYSRNERRYFFKTYSTLEMSNFIRIEPTNCAHSFTYKSSDENVAYVTPPQDRDDISLGILHIRTPGNATITMTATDGSGVSVKIPLTAIDTISIVNTSGIDNISPGKSLSFKALTDSGRTAPQGSVIWSVSGVTMTSGFKMTDLFTLNDKTGKLTMAPYTYSTVHDFIKRNEGKGYDYLIMKASYYPSKDFSYAITATKYIKVIPTLTISVLARDEQGNDISQLRFSHIGETAKLFPYSLPKAALNSDYSFASSNNSIAGVNSVGEVEAVSKGTAYIYINAGDHSGKKAKIKVIVDYPYVKNISLTESEVYLRTSIPSGMSDPEGSKYAESADFGVASIAPADEQKNVTVSSLNEKVAKVSLKEGCSADNPVYTITPVSSGTTKIRVMAADGSKKSAYVKVNVVSPVYNMSLSINDGTNTLKASDSKTLKLSAEGDAGSKNIRYMFFGIGDTQQERESSIAEMKKYVSLNSSNGAIKVNNAKTIGAYERKIYVYAQALDEWQSKSEPLEIRIKPGIVYINKLQAKSSDGLYNLASGASKSMRAVCNPDATDKGITWHIYDEDPGNPGSPADAEGSIYASINRNGKISVNKGLQTRCKVYVKARAVNGLDELGNVMLTESAPVGISLYPQIKSLQAGSYPQKGINTVNRGAYLELNVEAQGYGADDTLGEYKVTYSTGFAKVYLAANPQTGEYDGSHVKVYGLKKGRTKIVFAALDGSGKKVTYYVNTL